MRNKIIKIAFHWEECSLSEYTKIYGEFGGNTISNPIILDYIAKNFNIETRYFMHKVSGNLCDAAIATWGNSIAGDKKIAQKHGVNIPVAFDEVIIPYKLSGQKIIIPFATKVLSANHSDSVINAFAKLNSGREICIVKPITGKSRQTLNRQLNQFLSKGGQIHELKDITPNEFHDIYSLLFYKRRNKVAEEEQSKCFINNIDGVLFGNYLSLNGEPCAAQFITKTESVDTIYLDYINSGRNMDITEFSLGTICMWENIKKAFQYAEMVNKKLRFSFGNPTHDYKDRFCVRQPLMRTIA